MNFSSNWKRAVMLLQSCDVCTWVFPMLFSDSTNACSTTGFKYCFLVERYLKLSIIYIKVYNKFHDHSKLSILSGRSCQRAVEIRAVGSVDHEVAVLLFGLSALRTGTGVSTPMCQVHTYTPRTSAIFVAPSTMGFRAYVYIQYILYSASTNTKGDGYTGKLSRCVDLILGLHDRTNC
jgi:hypothetical protein